MIALTGTSFPATSSHWVGARRIARVVLDRAGDYNEKERKLLILRGH
jgi:hypothetical protein